MKKTIINGGIPISPSLNFITDSAEEFKKDYYAKKRLFSISVFAIIVAAVVSVIAKFLVNLINLVTNISFFGMFSLAPHSPAANHLGLWVILIPVIGGILVGCMALYGSKAIRGHGIPEAMEQILVNQSNIKPSITYLKPISSAIAIGTGGPFGAEGPIIATGGALGSTFGQLMKITANERKILLASGATAGMSAIFGTPIAAIFLAIELLLFEFSPKSILPIALACITGAAGHHLLFESGPVFPMPDLPTSSNLALGIYSLIGVIIGFVSMGVTKIVYFIEDQFEKLPIHWMWWPAIGGLVVGITGYFFPITLGVGYSNITDVLSGTMPLAVILSLFFFKFLSWSVALGSGTSGGTLAPLLTIGGAAGAILGIIISKILPDASISISMAALIGMSAMFAGASRAYLTSIAFALETTLQSHALLPLLAACTASYMISFFFMKNTIMTEKISRRGVATPDSYEPDILKKLTVAQVVKEDALILSLQSTIKEIRALIGSHFPSESTFIVVDQEGHYNGTVALSDILTTQNDSNATLATILKKGSLFIKSSDSLEKALDVMLSDDHELIPVVSSSENVVTGVLSCKDIIAACRSRIVENKEVKANLSLNHQHFNVLAKMKKAAKAE